MQRVKLGQQVKSLGINKANVADNCTARAILLDDPRVKFIGWDEKRKRTVELDQEMIIQYGFRPNTNYYYLIARLNTDMKGNVVDSDFTVEFLQLSSNVNDEFATAIQEFGPSFASIVMKKVNKKGEGGRDFSYIKVTPSNQTFFPDLMEKVQKLTEDKAAMESMWMLVDRATSISKEDYMKLLAEEASQSTTSAPQIAAPQQPKPQMIEGYEIAPPPQIPGNDFSAGDDFN